MVTTYAEKILAKVLGYGAAFTTILVISKSATDPVNAPKLAALGVVSSAAIAIVLRSRIPLRNGTFRVAAIIALVFVVASVNASIFSESPTSQNLYGAYGRNNGLITYVFFSFVFLAATLLSQQKSFESIVKSLVFAGLVNIVYCGWVIAFGDFIGWSNPYGNILGTFGNPNFIGAFLGIFLSAYVAYVISPNRSSIWKWSLVVIAPVTVFEILDSSAIQGRVVAAGGLALVLFSYLRFKISRVLLSVYSLAMILVGLLAILGALQMGPLSQYIYKTSVSLRGQYWLAGWNAGQSNPLNGVGMDALGDWYRSVRDQHALVLPGVNTVVNAAHNVFMDMFAFGGWPLFASYIGLVIFSGYCMVRTFLMLREFDATFTSVAVAWIGYQVQSIISINQIGLAIWGWLLSGTLIAYWRVRRKSVKNVQISETSPKEKKGSSSFASSTTGDSGILVATFVGALAGLIIALPPFVSDSNWKSAMSAQSLPQIEESMQPGYFNPQNVNRYLMNIQLLEQSNFNDLAYKYALEATEWNSKSFDTWKILYFLSKSTPEDKARAVAKMRELDPLNPDVTSR